MTKHTPAPWQVRYLKKTKPMYSLDEDDESPPEFFVEAKKLDPSHPYNIEIMGDDYGSELYPSEMREADAHLIAAAPELLEALQELMNEPLVHKAMTNGAFLKCRAAIAKARGESMNEITNTLEQLQKHLNTEIEKSISGFEHKKIAPRIKCKKGGLSLSIQASSAHYCSPRINTGPYKLVEIGFPSRRLPELIKYAEEPRRLTKTVYGYVPIEKVAAVIDKYGGIKE